MPSGGGFVFGPFRLDVRSKRVFRDGALVPLRPHQFTILLELVSRAGEVVAKDTLIDAAWRGTAVEDNSLMKAVSEIRAALSPDDGKRYIQTVSGHGYLFAHATERVDDHKTTDAEIDALLAPHLALVEGRAALASLKADQIARARAAFDQLVARDRANATYHVGLANASVLQYESTRADPAPDTDALHVAVEHAYEACRLDQDYGEAFATLGFVLERVGQRQKALAALERSVALQPRNWLHHLRRSMGSWGEQRLSAAERTLELLRDCAAARLLAATVFVARDVLSEAEREVDAGLATLTDASAAPERFAPVGLYWLKGLLLLARGQHDEALAAFERELALESHGHVYAREICANAWYATGAVHLRRGERDAACEGFGQALTRVPWHPLAHAGLMMLEPSRRRIAPDAAAGQSATMPFEAVLARAALLVADDDTAGAVCMVSKALAAAPAGNAGWLVPIEPLLGVRNDRAAWNPVLAALRTRAC